MQLAAAVDHLEARRAPVGAEPERGARVAGGAQGVAGVVAGLAADQRLGWRLATSRAHGAVPPVPPWAGSAPLACRRTAPARRSRDRRRPTPPLIDPLVPSREERIRPRR
jgi:hypothetical protein